LWLIISAGWQRHLCNHIGRIAGYCCFDLHSAVEHPRIRPESGRGGGVAEADHADSGCDEAH
ncbi:hypothetical protein ACQUFG_16935, partial [Enterococcus gallinarum]|uniref:hypothetical protein n=1 Tax=Enterococcus gallinarum TaxID=1353 RepID=UPI003D12A891